MIRQAATLALALLVPVLAMAQTAEEGVLVIPGNDPSLDWLFDVDPSALAEGVGEGVIGAANGTGISGIIGGLTVIASSAPAPAPRELVENGTGAVLRGLDKVSGEVIEAEIASGTGWEFGRLSVILGECRYPLEDPTSNAYGHLTITDNTLKTVIFDGWMVASSPALSALDHARYDVWLIRCKME